MLPKCFAMNPEHERFRRIDAAFRSGDLAAVRAAFDDPADFPNGSPHPAIGPCLEYAIYHGPLSLIRGLLELGADPRPPEHGGFPPLIAALSCSRAQAGVAPRADLLEVIALLPEFGADPGQRGINDWTALHMAVAQDQAAAVELLLAAGADGELRTRIDECETPGEMARAAGRTEIAARLAGGPSPPLRRGRGGVEFADLVAGSGAEARRGSQVEVAYDLHLNRGEAVENGSLCRFRVGHREVIAGLDHGVEGMRVGGVRRLRVGPHLAYGRKGVAGRIPANAVLIFTVRLLAAGESA